MTRVTVELEDLEALVMSTGAMKTIEGALASRKNDPFVRPYLNITPAHDRLAAAMRNAKRGAADTLVKWDEPLGEEEEEALLTVAALVDKDGIGRIAGNARALPGRILAPPDRLAAKGMIDIGQPVVGVVWAGEQHPNITADPSHWVVRITKRGYDVLSQIRAERARVAPVSPSNVAPSAG